MVARAARRGVSRTRRERHAEPQGGDPEHVLQQHVEGEARDAAFVEQLVAVDPRYFRPTEVDLLLGDPSKAKRVLGWEHKTAFEDLVAEMVRADMKNVLLERDRKQVDD